MTYSKRNWQLADLEARFGFPVLILAAFGATAAIAIIAMVSVAALRWAPIIDWTPQWWRASPVAAISETGLSLSQPLIRLLMLSVLVVPSYWFATEYSRERSAGFVDEITETPVLWWTTIKVRKWYRRFIVNATGAVTMTYLSAYGLTVVLWLLSDVGSYVLSGTRHQIDMSLIAFVVLTATLGILSARSLGPVRHALAAQAMPWRIWVGFVVTFETLAIIVTARDILHLLR
jgi:hypothetical protein